MDWARDGRLELFLHGLSDLDFLVIAESLSAVVALLVELGREAFSILPVMWSSGTGSGEHRSRKKVLTDASFPVVVISS